MFGLGVSHDLGVVRVSVNGVGKYVHTPRMSDDDDDHDLTMLDDGDDDDERLPLDDLSLIHI